MAIRIAIGQRIALRSPGPGEAVLEWLTVVGVAPDMRQQPRPRVWGETDPVVYVPYRTLPMDTAFLLMRGNVDAAGLAPTVRRSSWNSTPTSRSIA